MSIRTELAGPCMSGVAPPARYRQNKLTRSYQDSEKTATCQQAGSNEVVATPNLGVLAWPGAEINSSTVVSSTSHKISCIAGLLKDVIETQAAESVVQIGNVGVSVDVDVDVATADSDMVAEAILRGHCDCGRSDHNHRRNAHIKSCTRR